MTPFLVHYNIADHFHRCYQNRLHDQTVCLIACLPWNSFASLELVFAMICNYPSTFALNQLYMHVHTPNQSSSAESMMLLCMHFYIYDIQEDLMTVDGLMKHIA